MPNKKHTATKLLIQDLRFSQLWRFQSLSSGLWHCLVLQ